ncbi:ABC transporter ATP-binding protein [Noviherbaspirillum sp.]|uniref:ABC transporter ATP-binding protein n=1 Tax=Noviherbaspirillum sp. TaxID=1926288 RepID=UPI002B48B5E3|nr:ABC transporter ATP-binding protein [Noviherbaspirillum sp.]HJV80002.1 ABC transporter ATP-binding protein [Noviherbaspirillum sp.]
MVGAKQDEYVVQVQNVTKEFSGFTAVKNLNLNIRRGTIHALIGPNGAGKSTVFNLITKFLPPTSGRILYNGRDITSLEPDQVARLGMVRSFQISAVFPSLTVRDNVRIALQQHTGRSYHFWRPESTLESLRVRSIELLDMVGLANLADLTAAELSYGRKRALEIATTIALEPEVLLLDEPMAGLGTEDIARIANLIKMVAKERTVLMVEHNLSVVQDLSDVITVLARGEVLVEGNYSTVSKNPDVIAAYMGARNA